MSQVGLSRFVSYFKIRYEKDSRQKTLLEDMVGQEMKIYLAGVLGGGWFKRERGNFTLSNEVVVLFPSPK